MVNVHRVVAAVSALALIATLAFAAETRHAYLKSVNYKYSFKKIPNRGVRLIRKKSKAPCIQGRSWGYTNNKIWVDRGCEADFEYVMRRRH